MTPLQKLSSFAETPTPIEHYTCPEAVVKELLKTKVAYEQCETIQANLIYHYYVIVYPSLTRPSALNFEKILSSLRSQTFKNWHLLYIIN